MSTVRFRRVVSRMAYLPISCIEFGGRIRENYDVESIAENIKENGQLVPICVVDIGNGKYKLKFGGRRIKALELLGEHEVRAEIFDDEKLCDAIKEEGAENFIRKPHEFGEAIKYAKRRKEELGKTPGIKGRKDEIVAREIGWSRQKFSQALSIEQKALPEIKAAIGADKGLSIFGAYKIAQLPHKQQVQALNDAKNFYDSEGDDLSKYNIARRKKKRQEKFKSPEKYKPHPIYNIVRVAPNWENELFSDIAEIPVNSYMKEKQAFCVIEVPAYHLNRAFELVSIWGLQYDSLFTSWNPKIVGNCDCLLNQLPTYLLFARNNSEITYEQVWRCRFQAVIESDSSDLRYVVDQIFIGDEKRIDMNASQRHQKWIAFKASYGFNEETKDDIAVLETEE